MIESGRVALVWRVEGSRTRFHNLILLETQLEWQTKGVAAAQTSPSQTASAKKLFLDSSRLPPIDLRCALRCIQCWKAGRRLKSNEKIITGHKGLHSYLLLGWLPPWQDCARPNNPPQGLVAQTARAKIQGHPRCVDHLYLRYGLLFILFVRTTFYGSLLIGSSEGKF